MSGESWALAFAGDRIALVGDDGEGRLPRQAELARLLGTPDLEPLAAAVTLPPVEGCACRVFDLGDDFEARPGLRLEGLRYAFHLLPGSLFRVAGTARQKLVWLRTHGYCSRCGSPTRRRTDEEAMECSVCGQLHFARIAPAVIVRIERDDELLLARAHAWPAGVYSTLAGFVEPGESLEECIHREIEEEVGVRVANLRYFASQPHPFPHSLMIGFVADWAGGEIRADPREIEDARWFARDALPGLPHPMSIARALIEDFLAGGGG